jgi:hypothetical protein
VQRSETLLQHTSYRVVAVVNAYAALQFEFPAFWSVRIRLLDAFTERGIEGCHPMLYV